MATVGLELRGDSEVDVLKDAFSEYAKNSDELQRLKEKTVKFYEEIERHLSPSVRQEMKESKVTLLDEKERRKIDAVRQKPSLIFVGQTNSGKSSLINLILGGTYVAARETPCTARLVKLVSAQGRKQVAKVVTENGEVQFEKEIKKRMIPREIIELKEDRREKKSVTSYVHAQVNNEFLDSGIEIIDSPGLQENEVMDNMVLGQLSKIIPFVVYVLDGKNQLTNQDREDIKRIQQKTDATIFYVVTKVDKDEDEDDDDEEEDEMDVVIEKKTRAYNSLVREGFLPGRERMEDCKLFHGISSWRVKEYRKSGDRDKQVFMDDYDRFRRCMCEFVYEQLSAVTTSASTVLLASHSKCLDFFIGRANQSKTRPKELTQLLEECSDKESRIHHRMMGRVSNRKGALEKTIARNIENQKSDILSSAKSFKFKDIDISREGLVKSDEMAKRCTEQIESLVISMLTTNITACLSKEFGEEDSIMGDLALAVKELEDFDPDAEFSLSELLRQCTMASYKVENAITLEKAKWGSAMRNLFRNTLNAFRHPISAMRGQQRVDDKWKKSVAEDILGRVNAKAIAEKVITQGKDHLHACHFKFLEAAKDLQRVLKIAFQTGDKERASIRQIAPKLARMELATHSIRDTCMYGVPQPGRLIGRGSQGDVYECGRFMKNELCVMKVIDMERKINDPDDLSLEVHYSRKLGQNDRILPLYASILHQGFLFLVTPQMKWDLMKALPHKKSFGERLQIAIEVAKAIRFLHSEGIVHRDIKTENVLLGVSDEVKIADFGLCKAEGLITDSIVGAPIAMPPEVIRGEAHDKSIDVYAFGILLWFICDGTGTCPRNYAQIRRPMDLMFLCMDGHRPECNSKFDQSCWALMEKCWDGDASRRPTFDQIVEQLIKIKYKIADKRRKP
ncbi:dual serine/threonine and tyrosine protein kinase-like [Ptychodera flava]|uniref:dual serine/threonine and tyrosine protein kinase-like n=1 Tax=Ptychodera flava TaxID=63121 RepID=UPI00396A1E94